uniref:Uncharacterized protein n=1 Tax=Meloidogyne enterolobii TaxID=390850 RepID=A0A6V7UKM4_MELEN|nr:unnamed protein product [Meloidogyne enterolobii]
MLSNVFSIVLSSKINSSKFSLLILLIKSIFWNFPNFCMWKLLGEGNYIWKKKLYKKLYKTTSGRIM